MTYQLHQLTTFCADHRITPKIVFVPSIQAGTALGVALARSGTDWINLRFSTPEDLARDLVEPTFIADGWMPLPKDADLVEFAPILREYLSNPDNVFFKNQPYSQGLLRTIHRTLRALRISGTSPEALLRQRDNHKLRAIAQLYVAYQDCLETRRWYDGPDLFVAATDASDRAPKGAVYAILDETSLPGLARQFVHSVAGKNLRRIGRDHYGIPRPGTLAVSALEDVPTLPGPDCQPAGSLFVSTSDPPTIENVELRLCSGPEVEIDRALSRILTEGWPLDDVEIACSSPDLLEDAYGLTRQRGIPSTYGAGVSILLTRPGQTVRSVLNWLLSGGDRQWLRALLDGRQLNANLSDANWPEPLVTLSKLQSADTVSTSEVANLCAALLREHVTTLTESEEPARDSLVARLEDLASHCQAHGSITSVVGTLIDVVDQHRFDARSPQPGHLNVVPIDRAGFSGRSRLFVIGLDSSLFPGQPGEDPLLLDHERARISDTLEVLSTRPAAQVWHLVRLLGLSPHSILSASTYRLSDGQESEPASIIHHLANATQKLPEIDPILPSDPEHSPDVSTWKLAWSRQAGDIDAYGTTVPWLTAGSTADRERIERSFTRYKGLTGAVFGDLEGITWSASRLETLTRCPYRYFWRYVLRIDPPEEETGDTTRWLTPLEFGSLLHELYQLYMADLPDRDRPPSIDTGTNRILSLLDELIDTTTQTIAPPNPLAFKVDVERLRAAARVFVAEESKRPTDQIPRGFEVSFGFDENSGLSSPDPVRLSLGDLTIKLRGLIDRVDETSTGYVIWDYKTGSAFPYDSSDLLGGGQHLQWALYAHAFASMLAEKDAGEKIESGYYFASDREHGRKMLSTPPTRGELGQILKPVLSLAGRGAFPPIQKTSQCRFCDYKAICERDHVLPHSISTDLHPDVDKDLIDTATEWLST